MAKELLNDAELNVVKAENLSICNRFKNYYTFEIV